MNPRVDVLEERLGYRFRDRELLRRALTHRSWLFERGSPLPENDDNEQLEFLGDSILGFVVSESLFLSHPLASEGQLSKWKAHLVSATHLHRCAMDIGLGDFLLLGKGEEMSGGRKRKTLLANALEAVIAAVHIDGGIDAARALVKRHILAILEESDVLQPTSPLNYKSLLQETLQDLGLPLPTYEVVETSGPEHSKVFTIEARIGGRFLARATGSSKKAASQNAAEQLLQKLESLEKRESAAQ